jgi:hypothetical protein
MADAIVDFTTTGKLNFTGMIDSMLKDLLRYELRLQMLEMYKSFRPGLMDIVGKLFGGGGGTATQGGDAGVNYGSLFGKPHAKGGAFSGGVEKFAMGGAFTNSIVDSPTLFRFAHGTGMMGEAGPEAIMPLTRDGQGNLGVRSAQGNTQVVVNNYSTQEATTKETVDSRGNRRIEVTVGDMAAGEITRNGSSSQRSIQNTFGVKPALIRR